MISISMRKILTAVILSMFLSIPALSLDNGSYKAQNFVTKNGIVYDEAEVLLKDYGFKKRTYSGVSFVDEAENVLSKKGYKKPVQKNIIYEDIPVRKSVSQRPIYSAPVYKEDTLPAADGAKKVSYNAEIPAVSAVPVKISTDKTIKNTVKFYRKNHVVYTYSLPLLNTKFEFRVVEDVVLNNRVVIPKGTPVFGYVTFNTSAGESLEISRFYFEKDGKRVELLGTIGNGEFSSTGKVLKNQPVSLLSLGTRTKAPFIKLGTPAYIKKNQPYIIYYEYK